jgi:hypothetical protein
MRFLNRQDELEMLGRRLTSGGAELLVVYGRRRVGKTELLSHLGATARSLYFEATDTVRQDQLGDLTSELHRNSGNELLAAQPLASWEAALAAIGQFVGTERTLVVLDEFQLLAKQAPELETTLSRWWRTAGRSLPLTLVLAGSELSFFEDRVLSGQFYGRRTGQLKVEPFLAREAALFQPGYSPEDWVRTYSICGGIPYYLERFTDRRSLAENMLVEIFERTGLLHDEAELMLRQSIPDPANHIAVLRSIAHGHHRNNEISQRTQLEPAHVTKLLTSLERPRPGRRRSRTGSPTSSCASTTGSSTRPGPSCVPRLSHAPTCTTRFSLSSTTTPRSPGRTSAGSTCSARLPMWPRSVDGGGKYRQARAAAPRNGRSTLSP